MMDKEQDDSMATVQMSKADYAASEVFSTTSEPPPAYRRETSSVRIAKIIGLTVVVSSIIFGAFILASSYLQARASCDQMQTLDSILEKELMLETLQELPKAEALLSGRELPSDNEMQSLDKNGKDSLNIKQKPKSSGSDNDSDSLSSDNSFSESDEAEELNRVQIKMPLELSLSDLANGILQRNQKSRMNCVIERRRAEELVDNVPRMTPFGLNFNEPKKRVTGERMAIFCESGSAIKDDQDEELAEPRQISVQSIPIPFGAIPQQYPLTHMPQQQMPQQQMPQHQMPSQGMVPLQLQQQPVMPPQIQYIIRNIIAAQHEQHQQQQQQQQQQQPQPVMIRPMHQMQYSIPRQPQPQIQQQQQQPNEIRIHLQRIPLNNDDFQDREIPIEVLQARPNLIRPISSIRLQSVNIERDPQQEQQQKHQQSNHPSADFLRNAFGLNNEDLMNIQRAQERIEQELRTLAQEDSESNSQESAQDDDNSDENSMSLDQQLPINPQQSKTDEFKQDHDKSDAPKPIQVNADDESESNDESTQSQEEKDVSKILEVGRAAYGRSIITPVNIPIDMMQKDDTQSDGNRPHYVQPRSIREE